MGHVSNAPPRPRRAQPRCAAARRRQLAAQHHAQGGPEPDRGIRAADPAPHEGVVPAARGLPRVRRAARAVPAYPLQDLRTLHSHVPSGAWNAPDCDSLSSRRRCWACSSCDADRLAAERRGGARLGRRARMGRRARLHPRGRVRPVPVRPRPGARGGGRPAVRHGGGYGRRARLHRARRRDADVDLALPRRRRRRAPAARARQALRPVHRGARLLGRLLHAPRAGDPVQPRELRSGADQLEGAGDGRGDGARSAAADVRVGRARREPRRPRVDGGEGRDRAAGRDGGRRRVLARRQLAAERSA